MVRRGYIRADIYFLKKPFTKSFFCGILEMFRKIEVWLSLVERCVRDAEAVGSSPVTSTIFV